MWFAVLGIASSLFCFCVKKKSMSSKFFANRIEASGVEQHGIINYAFIMITREGTR
jgi:hypothetical protein